MCMPLVYLVLVACLGVVDEASLLSPSLPWVSFSFEANTSATITSLDISSRDADYMELFSFIQILSFRTAIISGHASRIEDKGMQRCLLSQRVAGSNSGRWDQ